VRVIAKRTLREFWENPDYADAEQPLKAWQSEARKAEWKTPQHIKAQYRHASFLKDNRVVFNIAGNKYRLVVKVNYALRIAYVRFLGTHKQYDAIDAETV
jgi:mRNA interferase HigB